MAPLNLAIEKNNIEIIKLLLKVKEIDINFVREYNENEHYEHRGDCNDDDIKKETTLLYQVVNNNNNEIVQLLVSNENIDVNFKNYFYENHENYFKERNREFNRKEKTKKETLLYLAVKKRKCRIG